MGWKYPQRSANLSRQNCSIWVTLIFIKDKRVCVKPLRSRLDAIQKLKPTTMIKGCRSFVGMVNFVSIFGPELQIC